MQTENMTMLTNADQLIEALKTCGLVNITWGGEQNMLWGNPLYNLPMLDVSCGNENQAWAINRAKEAISRGDEAAAREHIAPLVRQPVHHWARGQETACVPVKPFYDARVGDLTIHDRVRVECLGKMPDGSWCNRVSLIAVQGLLKPGSLPISDLKRYLKCENCGELSHVDLTIVWVCAERT